MRIHAHPKRGQRGTDIFSLGRLGAYCLLGHDRYRGAVMHQELDSVRFDLSQAGTGLQRILEKAMEHRAEDRHASAADFAEELARCVAGRP